MKRLSSSVVYAFALVASTVQLRAQATATPQSPAPPSTVPQSASWLRVRGEFRTRAERVDNIGFSPDRDDVFAVSRVRILATASTSHLSGTLQVQDARVGGKSVGTTGAPYTAALDVRQAYASLNTAKSGVVARVGRQEVAFADQRLVGGGNWVNAGRSWDGVRVTFESRALRADVFGLSLVRLLDGEFDKSGAGNRFAGAYLSTGRLVPKGTLEPYLFWRRDVNLMSEAQVPGTLSQFTTGVRMIGRLPRSLDYNVEMSLQTGSLGSDDVSAWAGHWLVRRSFTAKMTPHVMGEYNAASGDADPVDGTRGTFDQLYPTAHDKYGLVDQVGWRNIHDVRVGFDVSPFTSTPVTVNYHNFWLAEAHDALYATNGAAIARVASGAAGTHVGQELDVQFTRAVTPQVAIAAGYGQLMPGAFLKKATPGATYRGVFAMLTYAFQAER